MSRARSGPRARLRLPGVPAAPRPPPSRGPRRPRRRLPTARGGPPGPPALEGAPLPVPLPALGWRRRVSPGGAVPCGAPRGGIPVGPGPAAGAESDIRTDAVFPGSRGAPRPAVAFVDNSRQPDDRRQPEQRLASRRPAPAAAPRLHDLRHRLQRTGRREGLCDTAGERPTVPVKRRRVTAEMEGKYIINVPGAPRRGRRKSRNSKRLKVCRGHLSSTGWEPRRKRTRPQEGSPRGSSADWAMPWGPMGTKPPRATTTAPCSSTLASKKNSPNLPLRKALSREGPSRRKPPVRKPNRSPSPQPPSDRVAGTPPVAVRQQNRHRRRLKSAAAALWQCRSKRGVVTAPARRIKANPNFGWHQPVAAGAGRGRSSSLWPPAPSCALAAPTSRPAT
ncbi:uncharacterized protein LOC141974146 isoform X2 [Athene noctua]|uniref:uncharacterized protein LOC141974146 isoform X2 n=1 Tax=Athene noctua TaxID=126797 RepID=UPI003EBBBC89